MIFTCVGFLFKGGGTIVRDGAVIRSFMVYIKSLFLTMIW